jgi:hypothetical protein
MLDMQATFRAALGENKVRLYRKKADVIVGIRPATPGEVVETLIDGERETINTAKAGDHVVRGPSGEEYVISGEALANRYGPALNGPDAQGFSDHAAVGTVYAFQYDGEPNRFMAPWGEAMNVRPGDYVGTLQIGSNAFWRVDRRTFLATYAEAQDRTDVTE